MSRKSVKIGCWDVSSPKTLYMKVQPMLCRVRMFPKKKKKKIDVS